MCREIFYFSSLTLFNNHFIDLKKKWNHAQNSDLSFKEKFLILTFKTYHYQAPTDLFTCLNILSSLDLFNVWFENPAQVSCGVVKRAVKSRCFFLPLLLAHSLPAGYVRVLSGLGLLYIIFRPFLWSLTWRSNHSYLYFCNIYLLSSPFLSRHTCSTTEMFVSVLPFLSQV